MSSNEIKTYLYINMYATGSNLPVILVSQSLYSNSGALGSLKGRQKAIQMI